MCSFDDRDNRVCHFPTCESGVWVDGFVWYCATHSKEVVGVSSLKPSNYAPVYCALYPELSEIARTHGYALAIHGSMARDFDLVCVPWADLPAPSDAVVSHITRTFAIKTVGEATIKAHGRKVYTLSIGFGECFIDLSFMPVYEPVLGNHEQSQLDVG